MNHRGHWKVLSVLGDYAKQTFGQQRSMGQLVLSQTGALRAGPGGRQSVTGVTATVFGCNGFLGRYVVSRFGQAGSRVVCPHRCDHLDMQHLQPMGDLGAIATMPDFSIRDDEMIARMVSKSNVVINLIGTDRETWNYGFHEVHVDFPRKLAEICARTPTVERLIHLSCLGADKASPSPRLSTKAEGEAALKSAFGAATIIRAGPLVGIEDRFFMDMASWRFSDWGVPLFDGGYNRVQPVYVQDVAEAVWRTLEFRQAEGALYELGGPGVYTMKQLADIICDEMREDRKYHAMPTFLASAIANARDALAKRIPMHMITSDNFYTSSHVAESDTDKVVATVGAKTFADLHIEPRSVTEGIVIDPVRYWRKGGYMLGTNVGTNVPISSSAQV